MNLSDSSDESILSEEATKYVVKKIKKRVTRFLSMSRTVTENSTEILPSFDRDEIVLGKLLGSGGFSHVYELKTILSSYDNGSVEDKQQQKITSPSSRANLIQNSKKRRRGGKVPYVVKHMREKFLNDPRKFCHAGTDLIVEAHVLTSLSHPHILSIRGWASGAADSYDIGMNDGFFLILDRLEETLDQRIKKWDKQLKRYKEPFLRKINRNMSELLFVGRLQVGRDIASAFQYLHSNGIIYRDLKPGNIGFDANGVLKIFDFGLSRELPKPCPKSGKVKGSIVKDGEQLFDLSDNVGTQRYMAPEVACGQPYNQKADVYSLSIVMWECLSLARPFSGYSRIYHRTMVLEGYERPHIEGFWPCKIKALLRRSWSVDICRRPIMKSFYSILSQEIKALQSGCSTSNRRSAMVPQKRDSERSVSTAETIGTSVFTGGDSFEGNFCKEQIIMR